MGGHPWRHERQSLLKQCTLGLEIQLLNVVWKFLLLRSCCTKICPGLNADTMILPLSFKNIITNRKNKIHITDIAILPVLF